MLQYRPQPPPPKRGSVPGVGSSMKWCVIGSEEATRCPWPEREREREYDTCPATQGWCRCCQDIPWQNLGADRAAYNTENPWKPKEEGERRACSVCPCSASRMPGRAQAMEGAWPQAPPLPQPQPASAAMPHPGPRRLAAAAVALAALAAPPAPAQAWSTADAMAGLVAPWGLGPRCLAAQTVGAHPPRCVILPRGGCLARAAV